MSIRLGVTCTLIDGTCTAGETISKEFILNEGVESVLTSLFVESVSDTLDVTIYTLTETGKEVDVITFPTISAPTTNLLLRKAATGMQRFRVEAVCGAGGPATFEIRAKGISSGETSVKIQGADNFRVSRLDIGTVNTLIIPADLDDRSGMAVRNGDFDKPLNTLFVAHDTATLDAGDGYPVLPGEALQIDVKAGNEIWGKYDNDTGPVHIIETGG